MSDHLSCVNRTAENFLRELEKGNGFYEEAKIEVVAVDMTGMVVLKQPGPPPFFCGFKPSGRPIFTHDLRLARSFTKHCEELYESAERLITLGIDVKPHLTMWHEGRNRNAQF